MNQPIADKVTTSRPGVSDSITALYHHYKRDMFTAGVCLLGGDRQAAEDVLHDVFVSLAERDEIAARSSLRNFSPLLE